MSNASLLGTDSKRQNPNKVTDYLALFSNKSIGFFLNDLFSFHRHFVKVSR